MVVILVTKKRFVLLHVYICQILSTMIVYSIILFIRFHDKWLIFFLIYIKILQNDFKNTKIVLENEVS